MLAILTHKDYFLTLQSNFQHQFCKYTLFTLKVKVVRLVLVSTLQKSSSFLNREQHICFLIKGKNYVNKEQALPLQLRRRHAQFQPASSSLKSSTVARN